MRKKSFLVPFLVGILLIVTACGKNDQEENQETSQSEVVQETVTESPVLEETTDATEANQTSDQETKPLDAVDGEAVIPDGMAINPLTGLVITSEAAQRRPIGIMINNYKAAQPQSGIGQADVIYETLVEGGIARLFAVFSDFDAKKIGPIRSARHYYLDFAFDFDALYVHYGQSPQASTAFKELKAPNLNGLSYLDSIMCFQDPNRKRPHSTYTSYDGLMAAWATTDYRVERDTNGVSKFVFDSEGALGPLEAGESAKKVDLDFSNYQHAWFEYDESLSAYKRFQFKGPHIDVETGEQLVFDNIILQLANMWVIKGDQEGRMDMELVGSGQGYYVSMGKSIPITWEKPSHTEPTQYKTLDGNILLMRPGKTWIAVFPTSRPEGLIIE